MREKIKNISDLISSFAIISAALGFIIQFVIFFHFDLLQSAGAFSSDLAMRDGLIIFLLLSFLYFTFVYLPSSIKEVSIPDGAIFIFVLINILAFFFSDGIHWGVPVTFLILITMGIVKNFFKEDLDKENIKTIIHVLFVSISAILFFLLGVMQLKNEEIVKGENKNNYTICKEKKECFIRYENDKVSIIENNGKYEFLTTEEIKEIKE